MKEIDELLRKNGRRLTRAIKNRSPISDKSLIQFIDRLVTSEKAAVLINMIAIAGSVPEKLLDDFSDEFHRINEIVHRFFTVSSRGMTFSISTLHDIWQRTTAKEAEENVAYSREIYSFLKDTLNLSGCAISEWQNQIIKTNEGATLGQDVMSPENLHIENKVIGYLGISRERLLEILIDKRVRTFRSAISILWENRALFIDPLSIISVSYWRTKFFDSTLDETLRISADLLEDFIAKSWSPMPEDYDSLMKREHFLRSRIPEDIKKREENSHECFRYLGDMFLTYGKIAATNDLESAEQFFSSSINSLERAISRRNSNVELSTEILAVANSELGSLLKDGNKLEESAVYLQKAIEIANLVQNSYLHGRLRAQNIIASSHRLLGEIFANRSLATKAIFNLEKAVETYRALLINVDDSFGAIECDQGLALHELGELLIDEYRFLEAEEKLVEAFELFEHLNSEHPDNIKYLQNESIVADTLSQYHMAMNDPRGSYEEYRMYECAYRSHELKKSNAQFLGVGKMVIDADELRNLMENSNIDAFELYSRYVEETQRESSSLKPKLDIRKLVYLCNNYTDLYNFDKAEKALEQSISLYKQSEKQDPRSGQKTARLIATVSASLADKFRKESYLEKSISYFDKALLYYEYAFEYAETNTAKTKISEALFRTRNELEELKKGITSD